MTALALSMPARVAARHLRGDVELLDAQRIEKLRKDFLVLVKNVPHVVERVRADDYETYEEFKTVTKNYAAAFEKLIFADYARGALNKDESLSDADGRYIKQKLGEGAWTFYLTLKEVPYRFPSPADIAAWDKKVRRHAQVAWKDIKQVLDWYEQRHKRKVTLRTSDRLVIEGFRVEIMAFNDADSDHHEGISHIREALSIYKRKASKALPWLVQHQLPLELDFNVAAFSETLGRYNGGKTIFINPLSAASTPPQRIAKTLAHEMGHHLWNHLDAKAEAFWDAAIRQDYGPLDLSEVLSKWPPGATFSTDFVEAMATKDPILALQVDVLASGHEGLEYNRLSDFRDALDAGKTTVRVPQTPITGYAGKNSEEAFCEAVGLLVAYGPATVHEKIRYWLGIVIPGKVKTASLAQRVARRYLAES